VTEPYDLDAGTTEHYLDAALYDHEYRRRRRDVTFYRDLARRLASPAARPFSVIELGCGSGRVLLPLARDGHEVLGLDASRPMLARAAAGAARLAPPARRRVHLVQGDVRAWPISARAPLVIFPFNGFQHMYTRADAEAALVQARAGLAPGGRFAFDVLNPDLRWLTRDARKRWARTVFRHPTSGERLEYTTNQTYEPISQIAYIRIYYRQLDVPAEAARTHVVRLCHRQFFPAELEGICTSAGFRVEERWGGFSGEPLDGQSESQVLLCRAR
jgi:SAM-dependent methyltransferase